MSEAIQVYGLGIGIFYSEVKCSDFDGKKTLS